MELLLPIMLKSQEDKFYNEGSGLGVVSLENILFGLTICYDLRFPELCQGLSKTVSIIVNIANWPKERIDHWDTLIKARAIENQVYMIGVNRVGVDGNDQLYEESSLILRAEKFCHHQLMRILNFLKLNLRGLGSCARNFLLKRTETLPCIRIYCEFSGYKRNL